MLFTFTKSVDPDEMQHDAPFHLGLHCSQNYLFRGFPGIQRVYPGSGVVLDCIDS